MKSKKVLHTFCVWIFISSYASSYAMDDETIEAQIAHLSNLSPSELLATAKDFQAPHELRIQALKMLISQDKNLELQAQARLFLGSCYISGALHRRPSFDTACSLIEVVTHMQVSVNLQERAQQKLMLLTTLRQHRQRRTSYPS
jgi:hypothetical protein